MSATKKKSFKLAWILVPVAALGLYGVTYGKWFSKEQKAQIQGAKVQRGPLTISVLQHGNLASKDPVSVKSEIEGQTTILYLIPEGTFVKPGDLLVELNGADILEKKVAQAINVQNADATYIKAKAGFEIQESQNLTDVEAAQRKLDFAKLDLEKYTAPTGDYDQLEKQAQEKIDLAEAVLKSAQGTLEWTTKLTEKGFATKTDLERDTLSWDSAKITLEQATRAKDLLKKYDDPRKRKELQANVVEADRGLERAKLQAKSRIADFESGLLTSKSKLDLESEKLQKYLDQLAKCQIHAKEPGMVVYSRSDSGRMGGGDPIQEGTQVRERQEMLTIPRTEALIVEASIHESVLKRVEIGKPCKIRIDAIPSREFDGVVQFVALLPDKGSWWANPNQRLYRTEISVSNPTAEMRPGMSCALEIVSEKIPDCTYVPLQSVLLDKGKTIVFVPRADGTFEQRAVVVGRSNDAHVEVISGVTQGEEVLLAPPPGFTPQGEDKEKGDMLPAGAGSDATKPGSARPNSMMSPGGAPGNGGAPAAGGPDGHERRGPGGGGKHGLGGGGPGSAKDATPREGGKNSAGEKPAPGEQPANLEKPSDHAAAGHGGGESKARE